MGYQRIERFNARQAAAAGCTYYPTAAPCVTVGKDFFGNSFVASTKSNVNTRGESNRTTEVKEKILIDVEGDAMLLTVKRKSTSMVSSGKVEFVGLTANHATTKNKGSEKLKRVISRGYVASAKSVIVMDEFNNPEEFIDVVVSKKGKTRTARVSMAALLSGGRELVAKLASTHLEFRNADVYYLKRHIMDLVEVNDEKNIVHTAPHIKEGRVIVPDIAGVREKAVDGAELVNALNISEDEAAYTRAIKLIFFAIACVSALFPVFREMFGCIAPVLIECNDRTADLAVITKALENFLPIKKDKEVGSGCYCLGGLSEYKIAQAVEKMCNTDDSFTVALIDRSKIHSIPENSDFLVIEWENINITNFDGAVYWFIKQAADAEKFLENLDTLFEDYLPILKDEADTGLVNLVALIVAIADYTFKHSTSDEEFSVSTIGLVIDVLRNAAFGFRLNLADKFISTLLRSEAHIERLNKYTGNNEAILFDENIAFINPVLFKKMTEEVASTPIKIAKSLYSKGILSTNGVGYQREKRIRDKVHRFYALKESAIFHFGEVGFEPNDFEECRPELMIPIGNTDEKQIFYALENCSGNINGHMQVFGNTRSGKTNFLKHLALKAAYEGACVINVGFDTDLLSGFGDKTTKMAFSQTNSKKTFTARDVVALIDARGYGEKEAFGLDLLELAASSDGRVFASFDDAKTAAKALVEPEVADTIGADIDELEYGKSFDLSTVFTSGKITQIECDDEAQISLAISAIYQEKKKSKSTSPCLLIVDEAQKLKLDEQNPLIRLILRQGAKLGFIAVISSQYLSSKNGDAVVGLKGACDTKFFFKPAKPLDALHALGYKASDTDVAELLDNLAVGECLAVGNIATERCFVSKPIKLTIPLVK